MTTAASSTDEPLQICLTLPGLVENARVARQAMSGVATRNGLSDSDVEDLRIAVGEAFAVLAHPPTAATRIRFLCRLQDDQIEIHAERKPSRPLDVIAPISVAILEGVVDEARIDHANGRIELVKRAHNRSI